MAQKKQKSNSLMIGIIRLTVGILITYLFIIIINNNFDLLSIQLALTNTLQDNRVNLDTKDNLVVHFIDVGQGDSTLIEYNDYDILIDGGDKKKSNGLLKYLSAQNIDDIDLMIATHMDADHIGGLDDVFYKYDVKRVIDSGTIKDTKAFKEYQSALFAEGADYGEDDNLIIDYDEKFSIEIIETGDEFDSENNNSVVCLVSFKGIDLLFTGDMEYEVEQANLHSFKDIEILKLGHHGSKTSSSNSFLHITSPEYGIISCGIDNEYGHPHKEILEKLDEENIKVLRTDRLGTIVFSTDGTNMNFQ